MDSSNTEVSFYEASTSLSRKKSIHIDEYNEINSEKWQDEYFQMNRESNFPLIPNPMDYERNNENVKMKNLKKIETHNFHLVLILRTLRAIVMNGGM